MDQREISPADMKVVNKAPPPLYDQLEESLHTINCANEASEPTVAASVVKRYGKWFVLVHIIKRSNTFLYHWWTFYDTVTLGSVPVRLTCQNCRSLITTQIEYLPSERSHCTAFACLCFVFCWPCACLPCLCLIDSCRDVHHTCPVCGNLTGVVPPCWECENVGWISVFSNWIKC